MTQETGSRLGPYEILAPIGKGGMGEVYKARDTRLERTVAVKVLPEHLSSSPEVRQRFEREAKTISQLSHPHICALYDVGREGDTEYLVMEYLEGQTLSDRLGSGALPLSQTLKIGVEIADALDKAHRQGIVHRDLKPGNVMLTKTGVKLLDFGLAKAMEPAAPPSGATSLPTVMSAGRENLTQEGTILGTFQYMAPEQLEGRDADGRTDIFAFGCVLYEMATGRKAFSGASQASLISSIMKEEPAPVSTVQPTSPVALDRVIRKALSKDPEDRWQSAGDLGSELKWIAEGGSASGIAAPVVPARRRRFAWVPWVAALVLAAAGFAMGRRGHGVSAPEVLRASIEIPSEMDLESLNSNIALSPDGTVLVLAAVGADGKRLLWLRRLDGFALQPLGGTEDATIPFWSPDGKSIGFFAERKLKRVPAAGGPVQTICDAADGRGGTWSVDDVIVFAPAPFGGLSKVSAAGGAPVPVTHARKTGDTHRLPWFLPDGKRVLYVRGSQNISKGEPSSVEVVDLGSGKTWTAATEGSEAKFAEPGYLLFVRDGNLMAQPLDRSTVKTTGSAVPIAEGVMFRSIRWSANFAVSNTGRLVFQSAGAARRTRLTWFDLDGKELAKVGEAGMWGALSISPDGERAVVTSSVGGALTVRPEVLLFDLVRGVGSRLSYGPQGSLYGQWAPDGRRVALTEVGGGIVVKSVDGGSDSKTILEYRSNAWPLSWTPDGKTVLLRTQDPDTGAVNLAVVDADGGGKLRQIMPAEPDNFYNGSFSHDGRWLLYASSETGRRELYVVPYPGLGEKRQVSTSGAIYGAWLGENAVIYSQPPDGKLFAVDLETHGGGLRLAPPRPLFGGKAPPRGFFDVTRDGKRILISAPADASSSADIRVVSDWRAELGKK